ncbi:transposase [Schlesneria sp. DSM 10557]|uniref:transposase n=1 Tax=Schlesneria sp. DSM 10557 TaxID=3044399 RepID=UPI0035A087E4
MWVLKSGGRWQDLPERYPSPATCWRRLKEWTERGIMVKTWERLLKSLDRQKRLNWSQAMGDGTFSPAKKGAPRLVRPRKAKERNSC